MKEIFGLFFLAIENADLFISSPVRFLKPILFSSVKFYCLVVCNIESKASHSPGVILVVCYC